MFEKILTWLFGCTHRRTTFPQTWSGETHVTCLECGREMMYDWDRMINPEMES